MKLIVALDEGDVLVVADKHRINQVINNLLNNALKFTKQGQITLSTEKEKKYGKEAIVKIQDSGPGIDPDIMPRLFTKFEPNPIQEQALDFLLARVLLNSRR